MSKVVIITGASQGLGLSVARYLSKEDYKLVLIDSNEKQLKTVHNLLLKDNKNILSYGIRLTDEVELQQALDEVLDNFGSIDVLISLAGILLDMPTLECTITEVSALYTNNYLSHVNMVQLFLANRENIKTKGKILLFTSAEIKSPTSDFTHYYAMERAKDEYFNSIKSVIEKNNCAIEKIILPTFLSPGLREGLNYGGNAIKKINDINTTLLPNDVLELVIQRID